MLLRRTQEARVGTQTRAGRVLRSSLAAAARDARKREARVGAQAGCCAARLPLQREMRRKLNVHHKIALAFHLDEQTPL
jgi:hypothetical protein